MAWLTTSLRQLRAERVAALGLTGLVLVTAFVFALAPRVLDQVADGALRDEVSAATPVERNIQLLQERRVNPDPRGAMLGVQTLGERFETQLPASVRSLIVDRAYSADTSRWHIVADEAEQHFATLRFQPGVTDRIDLVEGRLPTAATETMPSWDESSPLPVRVFEAALAVPSAEEVGARVGDVLRMELDGTDRLNGGGHQGLIALRVVGLYRVPDPDAPYWLGDRALAAPVLRAVSSEVQFYDVAALLDPAAYEPFMRMTDEDQDVLRYTWRYYIDPLALDAEGADGLVADLRRLESVFPTSAAASGASEGVILRSSLLRLVETQRAGWHSAEAVLAVVAVGPAAVALIAMALVVLLMAQRRRVALVLQRGRGASSTQLTAGAVLEGSLLIVPAVVLAIGIATSLVATGPMTPTVVAAVAVGVVALVLLVALTVPSARLTPAGGRVAPGRRTGTRRLAIEAMIVLLAVGGAVLLRSRGVQGASSARGLTTPDPFIAAVPALLGLAAALVAMRLYPLVMRGVARVASWGRDLVPALAMRQAARGGTGGPMLLVLLATVALGAFSSATLVHLDRAADAVAWQETGADFRVSRGGDRLPGDLDPGALPGVEASAREITYTATYATRGIRLDLLAVDAPAYAGVAAGTPLAPEWPAELLGSAPTGALPVIVSSDLAEGKDPLAVGDPVEIVVEGRQLPLRVVEIRPTFPSVAIGDPFLVVALDHLAAMVPTLAEPTTSVFIRAADPAAAGLREALAVEDVGATLDGRAERAAELRSTPVIGAVTVGVAVAAIIALAYAGLAVAASLILSGAARAGEVAMLRTLGLSTRQSFALIVVEHGPTVVVAFIAGTVLGLGLFAVLRPGLGLGTVVGSPLDIPLAVDPGQLLLLLGAILVIVAVSIGLAGALQRSVAPVDALRGGIE